MTVPAAIHRDLATRPAMALMAVPMALVYAACANVCAILRPLKAFAGRWPAVGHIIIHRKPAGHQLARGMTCHNASALRGVKYPASFAGKR